MALELCEVTCPGGCLRESRVFLYKYWFLVNHRQVLGHGIMKKAVI